MPKTMQFRGAKATRLRLMILTVLSTTLLGVVGYGSAVHAAQAVDIDPRRSLVVTERAILSGFPLKRVLDQLVTQSGVAGLTSLDLFHQWWDTQNPAAQSFGHEPHCTGFLNGFPYTCRPAPSEGGQAAPTVNPFVDPDHKPDAYLPIGLFNRFDLAVADGSHCGEYRIVYAKRSGIQEPPLQRNLLIFEAKLPNPLPHQGLAGCRKIVEFWADLSKEDAIDKRARDLEGFYFQGQGNIAPVVHVSHYGNNPNQEGQVRTNQFLLAPNFAWSLREFQLLRTCNGGACRMRFIPVTDKVNPFGELHNADRTDSMAVGYRNHFLTQIEVNPDETDEPLQGLAADTLDDIRFNLPNDTYNTGQSQASGSVENDYVHHFTSATQATFATAMQAKLDAIGSPLTLTALVLRAESQSCAGCHRLLNGTGTPAPGMPIGGGLTWPPSLDFTHVTERQTEIIDGQTAFVISPALKNVFIPQRERIMEDYLNDKLKKPKKPKDTLSGRKTH